MKKTFASTIVFLTVLIGCFFAIAKTPAYRGPAEPANEAQRQLALRLRAHVQKLAGDIGARSLTRSPGGLEKAAAYIEEQFVNAGLRPTRQTYGVVGYFGDGLLGMTHASQSTSNIVVEIRGTDKGNEIVVIGAHYDGVQNSPAANDNATGVAAML
jgi:Zn-dependent M28 family amino/carboxypeptidase